jgi:hypothetical protein
MFDNEDIIEHASECPIIEVESGRDQPGTADDWPCLVSVSAIVDAKYLDGRRRSVKDEDRAPASDPKPKLAGALGLKFLDVNRSRIRVTR